MSKKQTPTFKFGKVKGSVVVSNNQSGGITQSSNSNNHEKFKFWPWIGGLVGFLASVVGILTWLDILPPKHDTTTKSKINPDSINGNYIPQKKIVQPQKYKIMFGKKNDNLERGNKYEIGDVSGDVIISNNQTGGITAHTVVIPEDKEIALKDNISVELTNQDGRTAIKISPKHGSWINPFFALPIGEIITKNILFEGPSNVFTDSVTGTIDFSFNDGYPTQKFDYRKWVTPNINSKSPIYLIYDTLPSAVVCGEWADADKQYTIRLK